jgi:signal peptidase I
MENTLRVNEMVLVDKLAYKFGEPQRGNIIMFHGPNPPITSTIPLVKRIIGLPGEKVEISDGTVKIIRADGSSMILNEPYIKEPPSYTFNSSVIPENEYFVLGDNRNNSEDSHYNYLVSRSEIIGRAWLCIWPPSSWGLVHNYSKYAVTTVTAVR